MNDELVMKEVVTLLSLTRDLLRDICVEEQIDNGLLDIFVEALVKQGQLLDELIVSLTVYLASQLDPEIGCEGTD